MQKKSIVSAKQEPNEKYKDKFNGDFIIKNLLEKNDSTEQEMYYVLSKMGVGQDLIYMLQNRY